MKKFFPNTTLSWAIYLLLVFIAFFLRFHQLGNESFWLDEIFSANIVEGEFNDIIDRIPADKPPLDYYLQAFTAPLGVAEFSHRLPAVISGVLTIMGIFAFGALIGSRRVGLLAMIMAVGSSILLYYSREARPYMPFTAMLCWQTAFFFLWWRLSIWHQFRKQTLLCLIPILLLSCLMVYTLYAAFVIFACQILFLIFWVLYGLGNKSRLKQRGKALISYLVVFVLVLLSTIPLHSRSDLHVPEDYYYRFMGYSLERVFGIFRSSYFFCCPKPVNTGFVVLSVTIVLFGLYACWKYRKRGAVYLLLTGTIANVAILCLYEYINRLFEIRYVIYGVPSLIVMLALALELIAGNRTLPSHWSKRVAYTLAGLFTITGISFIQLHKPSRYNWRDAVKHVCDNAKPGDLMVIPGRAEHTVVHYYRGRFNREDLKIYQSEDTIPPGNNDVWNLIWVGADHFREVGFNGVVVEQTTRSIPSEPVSEMAAQLTEPNLFIPGEVPTTLLGEGWSGQEDWGGEWKIRWAITQHSVIYFPLPEPTDGTFEVHLAGYNYEGANEQTATLVLNGKACENKVVPLGQGFVPLKWEVTKEQLVEGYNTLDFYFKWHHSPRDDRKNYGDHRALTAAFESIRWAPEQDEE